MEEERWFDRLDLGDERRAVPGEEVEPEVGGLGEHPRDALGDLHLGGVGGAGGDVLDDVEVIGPGALRRQDRTLAEGVADLSAEDDDTGLPSLCLLYTSDAADE